MSIGDGQRGSDGDRRRVVDPMEWAKRSGAVPDVLSDLNVVLVARRRRRVRAWAGAVCVLLAAGTVSWRVLEPPDAEPAAVAPTLLVHGAPARQTLPDGSVVELREGGEIVVEFTEGVRRVALMRGEAFFHVAKNAARPFIVEAEGVGVRAVGTAFAVERSGGGVQVIVAEGRVAVERAAEAHVLAALEVGGRAVVSSAEGLRTAEVSQLTAAEVATRLAWRIPVLEFSGTALGDVVELVNRHSGARLELEEPRLRDVRLSGMLRADNIETLVRLLEDDHGIQAVALSDGRIRLSRKR